jgi:hypothetical protein
MLVSGGGGGLPPAWPHVSGAILERSGFVRITTRELRHASLNRKNSLMHNISSIAAIHNMLQQHTCITSLGIHNIYKQKGAKHVQAHTYHIVSYITPTKWF